MEANKADNRLQVFFDGKPDEAARDELKANGFRWAPSVGAWQRQLNKNAYYAAGYISCIQPISGEKPIDVQRSVQQQESAAPDAHLTGERVSTPRGSFHVTDMTREQMETAGYGYHHSTDDGKYLIMGNGTQAFAIAAEQREQGNYMRTAELSTEQNYNMIDGQINNTPSVDELEEKAKRGEVISLSALAAAVKAEDGSTVYTMGTVDSEKVAAWLDASASPGEYGNAIFNGHVSWKKVAGVFSVLPKMEEGEEIIVEYDDGSTMTFTVTNVDIYGIDDVPETVMAYDTGDSRMTLITCYGESWNSGLGTRNQRCVVVAKPVDSSKIITPPAVTPNPDEDCDT